MNNDRVSWLQLVFHSSSHSLSTVSLPVFPTASAAIQLPKVLHTSTCFPSSNLSHFISQSSDPSSLSFRSSPLSKSHIISGCINEHQMKRQKSSILDFITGTERKKIKDEKGAAESPKKQLQNWGRNCSWRENLSQKEMWGKKEENRQRREPELIC